MFTSKLLTKSAIMNLGNDNQTTEFEKLLEDAVSEEEIMDPVITSKGRIFERAEIVNIIENGNGLDPIDRSPVTSEELRPVLLWPDLKEKYKQEKEANKKQNEEKDAYIKQLEERLAKLAEYDEKLSKEEELEASVEELKAREVTHNQLSNEKDAQIASLTEEVEALKEKIQLIHLEHIENMATLTKQKQKNGNEEKELKAIVPGVTKYQPKPMSKFPNTSGDVLGHLFSIKK